MGSLYNFHLCWTFPPFVWCLSLFLFLLVVCFSFLSFAVSSANMAHSSAYARTVPERSRSRDDHMWQRPQPQQWGRSYEPRPVAPPAPRLRKVLVIVDLLAVRPLMTKVHSDVMESTTCEVTPSELDGGTSPVHLQCTSQYSSPCILHGVQPSSLHQPAHLVHVGSILASFVHGH